MSYSFYSKIKRNKKMDRLVCTAELFCLSLFERKGEFLQRNLYIYLIFNSFYTVFCHRPWSLSIMSWAARTAIDQSTVVLEITTSCGFSFLSRSPTPDLLHCVIFVLYHGFQIGRVSHCNRGLGFVNLQTCRTEFV